VRIGRSRRYSASVLSVSSQVRLRCGPFIRDESFLTGRVYDHEVGHTFQYLLGPAGFGAIWAQGWATSKRVELFEGPPVHGGGCYNILEITAGFDGTAYADDC
jgi:hypothetical protein